MTNTLSNLFPSKPAEADFNLARSTVTFDAGSNHENTINTFIDVVDDLVVEGIETIVVSGSVASTSGSVPLSFVTGRDTTTITIADNDSKWQLFS